MVSVPNFPQMASVCICLCVGVCVFTKTFNGPHLQHICIRVWPWPMDIKELVSHGLIARYVDKGDSFSLGVNNGTCCQVKNMKILFQCMIILHRIWAGETTFRLTSLCSHFQIKRKAKLIKDALDAHTYLGEKRQSFGVIETSHLFSRPPLANC